MLPQLNNHTINVDPTTGGMNIHAVDVVIPIKGGSLVFERSHDSLRNLDIRHGCSFLFDERLYIDPDDSVRHIFRDGTEYRFTSNGNGTYSPSTSTNLQTLVKNGDGSWTVSYPSQVKRIFRSDGKLIESRDSSGNSLRFNWNLAVGDEATLITIDDPSARTITATQTNDASSITWTFRDWTGRSWSYGFTLSWFLTSFTDPEGNVTRYENVENSTNLFSGISKITLPDGTVWVAVEKLGDSPLGSKVSKLTFANGLEVTFSYDWTNRKTTISRGGRTTVVEYNSAGYVTKRTDPIGNVWLYAYDGSNNLTQITDPRLGTQVFTHDSKGNRLTERDQLNNTRTHTYHPTFNKVTQITEPAPFNYTTVFAYDPVYGRLESVTDRLGKATSYEYFSDGSVKKITDPNLNTVEFTYNSFGAVASVKDGRGKTTTMTYDQLGRLTSVKDPLNRISTRKYNPSGTLREATDPLGNSTRFAYNENGHQTEVHDALGRVTQYSFDGMGQMTQLRNALGNTVKFSYDKWGNLTELVNMNGQSWKFIYDVTDRMTRSTEPMGRDTTWAHDPYCNTTTKTDANGWKTKTSQDLLCRVSRVEYHDNSYVAFTYDNLSRRTRMTQPGKRYGEVKFGEFHYGTETVDDITYAFDAMDRMTSVVNPSSVGPKTISMAYDDGGRLQTLTDINNVATAYTYFGDNAMNTATRATKTVTYGRDDAGQVSTVTLPNGVVGTMSYDSAGRVTRMEYKKNADYLLVLSYSMDKVGNRTRKVVARGPGDKYGAAKFGQAGYGTKKPTSHDYAYDAANQLVSSSQDGRYVYDPQGNRLAKLTYGGETPSTHDAADELLASGDIGYEWTARGDLAAKREPSNGTTTYRFNYQGLMEEVALPGGSSYSYAYAGASPISGLRTKVINESTGATTQNFWHSSQSTDLPMLLNELDAAGSPLASYFVTGESTCGVLSSSGERWLLPDALGSTMALTDSLGVVTDTYDYDDFGAKTNVTGGSYNPLEFAGQYFDSDTNLGYHRARYYDSAAGRFLSLDPLDAAFGSNGFSYGFNSPTNIGDPTGLWPRVRISAVPGGIEVTMYDDAHTAVGVIARVMIEPPPHRDEKGVDEMISAVGIFTEQRPWRKRFYLSCTNKEKGTKYIVKVAGGLIILGSGRSRTDNTTAVVTVYP